MGDGRLQQHTGESMTSGGEHDHQPLPHHKRAWDQVDLLSSIIGRYVHVLHRHSDSWPSWDVAVKEDEDIHEVCLLVNQHLSKLGWLSKLTRSKDGWAMTVLPLPERQFPRKGGLVLFWVLSSLTLTLAADVWTRPVRQSGGWFSTSSFVDAFLGYAGPVLSVLAIATVVHWAVAKHHGVRAGTLMPVPDLTIALFAIGLFPHGWLLWPFGMLLIPSLPRMDARPWPDRASLGYTALSVPLVMGAGGVMLFVLGMFQTPEYIAATSAPLLTQPPVLLSLLSVELIHPDALTRLAWAHPWVHAGGFLMLMAWISLLPIPTFPGGRLLVARMGLFEARSSSTQSLLFVTALVFAYVFGVFTTFSLWYLVLALVLPLLFFFGNNLGSPVILDETKGLSESQHRRLGLLLLVVFLLLLPAQQPVVHGDSWDESMSVTVTSPPLAELLENGTWVSRSELRVTNPSYLAQPFAIDLRHEQRHVPWQAVWDCDGLDSWALNGNSGCGDVLLPGRTAIFWVNHTWEASSMPTKSNFTYIVELDGVVSLHEQTVMPSLEVVPSDHWFDVEAEPPQRCVNLHGVLTASNELNVSIDGVVLPNLTLESVQFVGGGLDMSLLTVPDRVCMSGVDPVVLDAASSTIQLNNDTFDVLKPMKEAHLQAFVPESGWLLDANTTAWGGLLDQGGVLQRGDVCAINTTMSNPPSPVSGPWVWDTNVREAGHMPSIEAGQPLTLNIDDGTNVSVCSDPFSPYPRLKFQVTQGPELLVNWLNTTTRFPTQPWALASNGTLLNAGMGSLSFTNPSNESVPFRLSREGGFGEEWSHDWDGTDLEPGTTSLNLAPPSSPLATMWVTFESNSFVLHLATYS